MCGIRAGDLQCCSVDGARELVTPGLRWRRITTEPTQILVGRTPTVYASAEEALGKLKSDSRYVAAEHCVCIACGAGL